MSKANPFFAAPLVHGSIVTYDGKQFRVDITQDPDAAAPWLEHDGHGVIIEVKRRDEMRPGLVRLRGNEYYDIPASVERALADGWGLRKAEYDDVKAGLSPDATVLETQHAIAERAVELDMKRMRGWCRDAWHWIGVIVTRIDGNAYVEPDYRFALWTIESDCGDYINDVVMQLIVEQV